MSLAWTAEARFSSYAVFRNGIEIGRTISPAFTDSGLTPGVAYAYIVRGIENGALSEPSPALTIATTAAAGSAFLNLLDPASRSQIMVRDIEIANDGSIFVAGGAFSAAFPTTAGAYDRTFATGGGSTGSTGPADAFVMKFARDGALIWSTLIGGPNHDRAYGLEVAPDGGVLIAGRAGEGFPTTAGVIQPAFAGDNAPNAAYGRQDGFVAKLSADGSTLLWSTYLGDAGPGIIRDIAVDGAGRPHIAAAMRAGLTTSAGAPQAAPRGAVDLYYARLAAGGDAVQYASYLGGLEAPGARPGTPSIEVAGDVATLAIDDSGAGAPTTAGAYQPTLRGGSDFLIAKFSVTGGLLFATYLGGSGDETLETHNLAVDAAGRVVLYGMTASTDFPGTAGAYQATFGGGRNDAVLAAMSADGARLDAATYLGGPGVEDTQGVAVLSTGDIFIGGGSSSTTLGTTAAAIQRTNAGGADGVLARFRPDLRTADYLTYLGGGRDDVNRGLAVGPSNRIAYGGVTASGDFPVTAGGATTPVGAYTGIVGAGNY